MKQNLSESVAGSRKCDKKLLKSVTDIENCNSYYKNETKKNEDKFLSLAYGCKYDIVILRKLEINGISIICLRKGRLTERVHISFQIHVNLYKQVMYQMNAVQC